MSDIKSGDLRPLKGRNISKFKPGMKFLIADDNVYNIVCL